MDKPIQFKFWNNITGWLVFAISFVVYLLTLEPTASFWDCGEFLACALKLEVSHPPGAPFFMLMGRIAASLYPANPTVMINGMSALASAFTILFLFWTITWFGRKLAGEGWDKSNITKISIIAAGFIGSLSYAFTDSFWFSAVEAEVYAFSSMLTALVFWCVLKWEESYDTSKYSERWLILIAYLFGLSVGVHLLNLLVIPAIVLVYYYKKYPVTKINTFKALGISALLLFVFLVIILKGIPRFLSLLELFSVNTLKFAFNTGFIAGLIVIFALPVVGYFVFSRKGNILGVRASLYVFVVLIGISSYGVIVVRSYANPPIDMNNPEDPFALEYYLNREQYGQRPVVYGHSFNSPIDTSIERYSYERFNGEYIKYPLNPKIVYNPNTLTLFPRMCSNERSHKEAYLSWVGKLNGKKIETSEGTKTLPSLGDNIRFYWLYQLNYMYFRYFMWNFAGRQNDIQGRSQPNYGNWQSGIKFIDNIRLGNQDKVPEWLKNNPGSNKYYFIPLLLGLIGLLFHYQKDAKNFTIVLFFYVLTGIALTVYLNEVPITPRERDYVYVGSFYVFAIWIGLGVMALFNMLLPYFKKKYALAGASILGLLSPVILISQNYDDHDRSGRYAVIEYARNYLESCEPNAILFTSADNDTYPLWYAQEVEGVRPDIRLVLYPYLNFGWFTDQKRYALYESKGIKMNLAADKYVGGKRQFLPVYSFDNFREELNKVIQFVARDDDDALIPMQDGQKINFFPGKNTYLLHKRDILNGTSNNNVYDTVYINLKKNYLQMNELVLLDIIASNNWERPIYFTSEEIPNNMGLTNYLKLDGMAFKLTPQYTPYEDHNDIGYIDTDELYHKLMEKFSYESLKDPKVYLDYTHVFTVNTSGLRDKFVRLAEQLIVEKKFEKAEKVLDKIVEILPGAKIPYDYQLVRMAGLYYHLDKVAKADDLFRKAQKFCTENMEYFVMLKRKGMEPGYYEVRMSFFMLQMLMQVADAQKKDTNLMEMRIVWDRAAPLFLSE